MVCAYTRPRYQVSVYRTIVPLVFIFSVFFVAILDLLHDADAMHNLCKLLTEFFFQKYDRCICNCKLHFLGHHSYFTKDFEMLLAV